MKIAVYGGSFNPPHKGHAKAAMDVMAWLDPDIILIIPTANPPHKDFDDGSPAPEHRLEMAKLFAENLPKAEVCEVELNRGGKSYTVDTIEELCKLYPGSELYLMIGTDMLLIFEKWRSFRRLLELVTVVGFIRKIGEETEVYNHVEYLKNEYSGNILLLERESLDISSTEIRALLQNRTGSKFIPDEVYGYIIKNRLYGAKPELSWLREKSYAYHSPNRISHIAGTEQEAVRLAERWGVDAGMAAEAAILHDITKKLTPQEQLLLCSKYGIIADSLEESSHKLLHSKTGAALSREQFGIDNAVYDAISYHTTGRPNMTQLEKVIYIADYIEPTRDFEGLEQLRKLAYEDLDKAILLGLKMSLEEIEGRGQIPHRRSVDALEFFLNC